MAFLAFLVLGWTWAWASPVGASPDESFHLTSAWCAWGEHDTCEFVDQARSVVVPTQVGSVQCFVLRSDVSADCQRNDRTGVVATERFNQDLGQYPPLYHNAMRLFVGPDVERSVILMRMFNVVLAGVAIFAAWAIASPVVRRAAVLAWGVTIVPIGFYYIASVNPSGWAIMAGGTFWLFLLTLSEEGTLRTTRGRLALLGVLVTASIGLLARADLAAALGISVIAVAILSGRSSLRGSALWAAIFVVIGGVWIAILFRVGSYFASLNLTVPEGFRDTNQPNPLLRVFAEFPAFLAGHFGFQPAWVALPEYRYAEVEGWVNEAYVYGLGSYDVQLPSMVSVLTILSLGMLIFVGLTDSSKRKLAALVVAFGGLIAFILLQRSLTDWGSSDSSGLTHWYLHPRYTMPILLVAIGILLLVQNSSRPLLNRAQAWLIGLSLVMASTVSLTAVIFRYSRGQLESWLTLPTGKDWWWTWGPDPVFLVGASLISGVTLFSFVLAFGTRAVVAQSNDEYAEKQESQKSCI